MSEPTAAELWVVLTLIRERDAARAELAAVKAERDFEEARAERLTAELAAAREGPP